MKLSETNNNTDSVFKSPLAYFYRSGREADQWLNQFISNGFIQNQKIIFLLPEINDRVKNYPFSGLKFDDHQIEVHSAKDLFIRENVFSPKFFADFISSQIKVSQKNGFSTTRVWSDLTWLFTDQVEHELVYGWLSTFTENPIADVEVYFCYDQNQLTANHFLHLLEIHSVLQMDEKVIENPLKMTAASPISPHLQATTGSIETNAIQEFKEISEFQDTLLSNAPYGILTVRLDGKISTANKTALSSVGYAHISEVRETLFIDLISPDDRIEASRLFFGDSTPGENHQSLECKILSREGSPISVDLRCLWKKFPGSSDPQLICYFNDITHHLEIEQALRISEQRYRFLVESQGEGVVMINAADTIDYINAAGGNLLDGDPNNIVGRPIIDFIPESQLQRLQIQLEKRRKGFSSSYELSLKTLANQQREVLVTATPRYTPDGKYNGTLAIFRDITERKQLEEKLRYQSTHDTMTNLFNRAFFDELIENFDPEKSPLTGIIIVDVDGLKEVNDQDGHKAGDQLLKEVARILSTSFRGSDSIARIGGDEFAILLSDTDEIHLHQAILRLRHNLEEANSNLPNDEQISFSIGGATTASTRDLNQALMLADIRMYRQKRRKKASHGSQLVE